jgi:hypothetical protein
MTHSIFRSLAFLVIGLSFSSASYAGDEGVSPEELLPIEVWSHVLQFLPNCRTIQPAQVCRYFNALIKSNRKMEFRNYWSELIEEWPDYIVFENQFVKIPEGFLPGEKTDSSKISVAAFEADKYPVTRKLWSDMDMPIPDPLKATWDSCLSCPITHVTWEETPGLHDQVGSEAEIQEFLRRLNMKTAKLECTYDLPTDIQLHYMIRADATGDRTAPYSIGQGGVDVDDTNVDDYLTHWNNSNGTIQPVGLKKLNAFGIELGNVWKVSKDLYKHLHERTRGSWPLGRSMRGGSWHNIVTSAAKSDVRRMAQTGSSGRRDNIGFSLVRSCRFALSSLRQ